MLRSGAYSVHDPYGTRTRARRRTFAILAGGLVLVGLIWGAVSIPWTAFLAKATYAAPAHGVRVNDARTADLTSHPELQNLVRADYWPIIYVDAAAALPSITDKTEGETTMWAYCPPPRNIDECLTTFDQKHPRIMVAGRYDVVKDRYVSARPVAIWSPTEDRNRQLACSLSRDYDGTVLARVVGDFDKTYKLLGAKYRTDGRVHTVYLDRKADSRWRCGGVYVGTGKK